MLLDVHFCSLEGGGGGGRGQKLGKIWLTQLLSDPLLWQSESSEVLQHSSKMKMNGKKNKLLPISPPRSGRNFPNTKSRDKHLKQKKTFILCFLFQHWASSYKQWEVEVVPAPFIAIYFNFWTMYWVRDHSYTKQACFQNHQPTLVRHMSCFESKRKL